MIFKELFSSSSPNKIYGKALEKCRSHPEVSPQGRVTQTLIIGRESGQNSHTGSKTSEIYIIMLELFMLLALY